jgi:hypothetical protein
MPYILPRAVIISILIGQLRNIFKAFEGRHIRKEDLIILYTNNSASLYSSSGGQYATFYYVQEKSKIKNKEKSSQNGSKIQ